MDSLLESQNKFFLDEIYNFLEQVITLWQKNEITLAAMNTALKFAHKYLDQPDIQIKFKNRTPIPICYFSSYLILAGSFLYSSLKSLSFNLKLFSLNKTDKLLREFIEKRKPSAIIFTMTQYYHAEIFKELVIYLHNKKLKVFVGGVPFNYDENFKGGFPDCIFPDDIHHLSQLLNDIIKEDVK